MAVLYVTSSEGATGKTTICAGIGKHLLDNGHKIGFLEPLISDKTADNSCTFIKHIFDLDESVDSLCPVVSGQKDLKSSLKEACARVSSGKDVVIMEGTGAQSQIDYATVQALGAKVIVVEGYPVKTGFANKYKDFGKSLLGVVLNRVPRNKLEQERNEASVQLGKAGINILGVLPEDRLLCSLTVGELAEHLHGEIMNSVEESAELVENFMLGAMTVDTGTDYFGRKANKAVVVRSERPDMQLAALETPTRCLVVSGEAELLSAVRYGAESKKVPIISVKGDTDATVTAIEDALGKARFNQEKKLPRLAAIMEQNFDFQALYQGLGL
ncbi:DRTGG domain-containing protein [Chloroflexota bacterium]